MVSKWDYVFKIENIFHKVLKIINPIIFDLGNSIKARSKLDEFTTNTTKIYSLKKDFLKKMMEQRLTIIGLGVENLKISNSFYENVFGWKKQDSSNENISFFKLNGILLSLYPKDKLAEDAGVDPKGEGFKAFSLAFNARSEDDVNSIISNLESKGAKIVKRPEKVFWGGYSGYIADPDDNLWEIAFNPFLPLDEDGNVK